MKILSFGCRLNTFESKIIEGLLSDKDDLFVINTCAVTAEAERQCRQTIRKTAREHPNMKIIVTGCAAQLNPEQYSKIPEVYKVVGNIEKLNRDKLLSDKKVEVSDIMKSETSVPVVSDFESRTRAFLQIQQGCSHACTFCIVHTARGKNKGLLPDQVIDEAKRFVDKGFLELVLTGVDIASYPYGLNDLLKRILKEVKGLKRLRLGSFDPALMTDEFISIMADNEIMMPHLHLSMQSGDDMILKRMGRRHLSGSVVEACQKLIERRKDFVFGADMIAGFPTETEEMFFNTAEFIKNAPISLLHVFPYSERPMTPAAKMPMVEMKIRKERASYLRELGGRLLNLKLAEFEGKRLNVLIERNGVGYSENYLKVKTNSNKTGEIVSVLITKRNENELVGQA